MLSKILCCVIGCCAVTGHAQLAAPASPPETLGRQAGVALAVKTYSTNVVNVVEPTTNIVPANQPALSAQTFVRVPETFNPKDVKVPDEPLPTVVTNNSQSVNLTNSGLAVFVSVPKIVGQKAIVQLKLQNNLADKIESARAVCFLMDEQGQMVGQSTKWVIGENKIHLEPKGETIFNFVITSSQPFTTTNLVAKVSFSRMVLAGERLIDPQKTVQIQNAK